LEPVACGQDDGVDAVEIAVVAVGVVAGLGERALGDRQRAAVFSQRRVLVGGGRGIGLAVRGYGLAVGGERAGERAAVIIGHGVGSAASSA
jgi:hypothetical protein